jgi:hypothetical protein
MKTMILALAAVATLGIAAPAVAKDNAPRAAIDQVSSQDFSSRHRHHWRHHHWRHRHHVRVCKTFWRYGRRVTVCR